MTEPSTSVDVLAGLQEEIADHLLSEAEVEALGKDPRAFLLARTNSPETVEAIVGAVVQAYFRSLLAKASEGEKWDEDRLVKALMKARTLAVHKLIDALESGAPNHDQLVAIAKVLKDEE